MAPPARLKLTRPKQLDFEPACNKYGSVAKFKDLRIY